MLKRVDDDMFVCYGWYDDRCAACIDNLFVISVAQGGVDALMVGRDADERTVFMFWENRINLI